jgi:hypothetical protein
VIQAAFQPHRLLLAQAGQEIVWMRVAFHGLIR